jgi:hypothetical protein
MQIEISLRCPRCNNEIKIYNKNRCEEINKESKDIFFNFAKQSSIELKDDISSNNIANNQKKNPKLLIKEYFNNLALEIGITKDKKELAKLKRRLLKSKLRVSKQVNDEFKKNKEKLLKKVEKKLKK